MKLRYEASNWEIRGPNGQIINDKKRISLKKGQDVKEAVWTEKDEKEKK